MYNVHVYLKTKKTLHPNLLKGLYSNKQSMMVLKQY